MEIITAVVRELGQFGIIFAPCQDAYVNDKWYWGIGSPKIIIIQHDNILEIGKTFYAAAPRGSTASPSAFKTITRHFDMANPSTNIESIMKFIVGAEAFKKLQYRDSWSPFLEIL